MPHIILIILEMVLESTVLVYQKYLIDIEFYSVEFVSFIFGFCNSIFLSIIEIINIYCGKIMSLNHAYINIINFEISWTIVFSFFCCSIFYIFYYQIIFHFSPLHILIYYITAEFILNFNIILDNETIIILILILIYILSIFSFLIFLEIIELKFCGLNKNTRRNIIKREQDEILDIFNLEDNEENEISSNKTNKNNSIIIELPFGYTYKI